MLSNRSAHLPPLGARLERRKDESNITTRAGFNPRPGASSGATCMLAHDYPIAWVSIRAPERAPGRRVDNGLVVSNGLVSIRAPERAPGRPISKHISIASLEFQSAPRSELRGDSGVHLPHALPLCFNPRPGASS